MNQSPKSFHASLPRKRMGAGVVFLNGRQQVLLVNPTYKITWELPGGAVEDGESPRAAARREVSEELGLTIDDYSMICVDYNESADGYLESLMFLFSAPTLTSSQEAAIRLPPEELSEWRWCDLADAGSMLGERVGRRLAVCVTGGNPAAGLYLENQTTIIGSA